MLNWRKFFASFYARLRRWYQIFNIHGGFSFESLVKTTMLCYVGIAFYPVEVSQ